MWTKYDQKWLNLNFFSLVGFAGLASAPTTVRKNDRLSVRQMDRADARPATRFLQSWWCQGLPWNPFLWKSPAFLDRSPSLCDSLPFRAVWVAEGLTGREWSLRSRTEMNKYLLSYNLNLRRKGRGCSDTARDSRTGPVFQNWVGAVSFITLKPIPG